MTKTAAVAETSPDTTDDDFRLWTESVSKKCNRRWGLNLDDLPDMNTRAAFDAGVTPQEFFEDEVVELVREDLAELTGLEEED